MTNPNLQPFFIVGCGRSGTTLLRTLLNSHPDIGIPQESLFIVDYLRVAERVDLGELKRLIVREPELEEWGIHARTEDLDGCETIAETIDRLHRIYLAPQRKSRWGQKTPRFVRNIALLIDHFPGSLFLHLIRDPRAVVSSLIASDVHRSNAYYASRRWRNDVSRGLASEKLFPGRVRTVRYEDLVSDTETILMSIGEFLGFDHNRIMLEEAQTAAADYSRFYEAIHANLGLPPTAGFINKWRDRLREDEVALVESIAGELMEQLGYVREFQGSAQAPVGKLRPRVSRAVGLVRQATQYLRFRRRYLFHLIDRKRRLGLMRDFIAEVNY